MDTKAMIEKATGGLELVKGILSLKKNDVKLDRVTHYLQEQFSGADSEAFILNSMYLSFIKII
jgi:hypothetical protein